MYPTDGTQLCTAIYSRRNSREFVFLLSCVSRSSLSLTKLQLQRATLKTKRRQSYTMFKTSRPHRKLSHAPLHQGEWPSQGPKKVWGMKWWHRPPLSSCKIWWKSRDARRRERTKCDVFHFLPAGSARRAALPVLLLLTGRFFGFSPRRGDTVHR